mgnify:CR=1 FL=1
MSAPRQDVTDEELERLAKEIESARQDVERIKADRRRAEEAGGHALRSIGALLGLF